MGNGDVFLMARMSENGILDRYLAEHCNGNSNLEFCKYKDSLPMYGNDFIWANDKPFQKTGGFYKAHEEYSIIIQETLLNYKYLLLHLKEAFKGTLLQFSNFKIGDGLHRYNNESSIYKHIEWLLPGELQSYLGSDQSANKLDFQYINNYQNWLIFISALILFYYFKNSDKFNDINLPLFPIVLFILIFLISNAAICGALSGIFDRYQARVVWLVPFISMLILILSIKEKIRSHE